MWQTDATSWTATSSILISIDFFIKIECRYCIISIEGRFNGLYRANKTITSNGYYDEIHFVYIKYIRDVK